MFFHIVLERNMQLHPRHFGRELREKLVSKLMKDVEGTCSGRHGFVVERVSLLFRLSIFVLCFGRLKGRYLKLLLLWLIRSDT